MPGWRVGFALGNPELVGALRKIKSYLDYGIFQPIQIASTVALNELSEESKTICEIYCQRRNSLVDGLQRIGWEVEKPQGTMFVWARIPEAYQAMGSLEFAKLVLAAGEGGSGAGHRIRRRRRRSRALCVGGKCPSHPPGVARAPQSDLNSTTRKNHENHLCRTHRAWQCRGWRCYHPHATSRFDRAKAGRAPVDKARRTGATRNVPARRRCRLLR